MAGLFKVGDSVTLMISEALPGRERMTDSVVVGEISPGFYECTTPMGITVLVPEAALSPQVK